MRYSSILLLGIFFLFSCKEKKETYTVQEQTVNEAVYASGAIEPIAFYKITTPFSDRILKTYVLEGDTVEKGKLLAILGTEADARELKNIEQQMAIAQENADNQSAALKAIEIQIKAAKSKFTADSLNAARYERLAVTGAVSNKESEQFRITAQNSLADYENLQAEWNVRKSDLTAKLLTVQQQKDRVLQTTETKRLVSPIRGVVLTKHYKEGEILPDAQPLYTIGNSTSYILKLIVDERDIQKIQPGQKVVFETDAQEGKQFEAAISNVKPVSQENTRSFEVEAIVKSGGNFFSRASVEANIVIRSSAKAIAIPEDYLAGKDSVIIQTNQEETKKIRITRGTQSNNWIEITSGLKRGDVIIKKETR